MPQMVSPVDWTQLRNHVLEDTSMETYQLKEKQNEKKKGTTEYPRTVGKLQKGVLYILLEYQKKQEEILEMIKGSIFQN